MHVSVHDLLKLNRKCAKVSAYSSGVTSRDHFSVLLNNQHVIHQLKEES